MSALLESTHPARTAEPLPRTFLRALDTPAREALLLARRSALRTIAPAAAGAALIAACSLAAAAIGPPMSQSVARRLADADLLRALFEALLVVVPSSAVLSSYVRIGVSVRTLVASFALGIFTAGVVLAASMPLVAFLSVVSRAQAHASPAWLLPPLALVTIAATVERVVRALDETSRARAVIWLVNLSLIAVFAIRAF